jgi:hypothetical protein
MAYINKQDTIGTKTPLDKAEFGYDDYVAGGDAGRVHIGTHEGNKKLAFYDETIEDINRAVSKTLPFNGYIGDKKPMIFSTAVGNEYKTKLPDGYVKVNDKIVSTNDLEIDMTGLVPEVFIAPDVPVVDGDYQVEGNTIKRLEDGVLVDRTQFGITNKILATMREDGTIKTEVCFVDTDIKDCGNVHVVMTDNGYIRSDGKKGLYTKDDDIVTPIGTWTVSNSGSFHEIYNYFGMYEDIDGAIGVRSPLLNSTADCFDPSNVGADIGHPQGIDKSKHVTEDQWIDLRISANTVSESDELNRVSVKAKSGQLDGVGGVVATIYAQEFILYGVSFDGVNTDINSGTDSSYTLSRLEAGDIVKIRGNSGTWYNGYSKIGDIHIFLNEEYEDVSFDFTDNNATSYLLCATRTLPHLSSGTALRPEILANPDRYSDDMKDILASGNPLMFTPNLVDDTGASNIPDGNKTVFKLNNKFTTAHQVLKSTNKGVSWSPLTLDTHYTVSTVTNSITFASAPSADDMIMISNTAKLEAFKVQDLTGFEVIAESDYILCANTNNAITDVASVTNAITGSISTRTDVTEELVILSRINGTLKEYAQTMTTEDAMFSFLIAKDSDGMLYLGVYSSTVGSIDTTDGYLVYPLNKYGEA